MIERIEMGARVVMVVAYVAVCAGFLLMVFPGARGQLGRAWAHQLHAWRLGSWQARRTPPPHWTAALRRTDLPDEPAA